MLTFWKLSLFHFVLFFLPWKPFFDNQPCLLFFLLSFWLFTFCPLRRKPFGVCLEFWQFKFKRKPSWGNLYWYILISTQSFAGLMGWRDMSFCFSHFHLCVTRVPFRLFIWGILFFFLNRILLNLEKKCYFIECPTFRGMSVSKNVAKEVWALLHYLLYSRMHAISLILTFWKWRKHLQTWCFFQSLCCLRTEKMC